MGGPGSTYLDNIIQKLGYCNHKLGINEKIKYKYNVIHVFLKYPKLFSFFLFAIVISIVFLIQYLVKK